MKDIIVNREMKTTSRMIAEYFKKSHRNVLQSIYKIMEDDPAFSLLNFQQREFKNDRGQSFPEFEVTRDGFSLLAMGFTGREAFAWKVKILKAFNAMEQELLKQKDALEWKTARLQGKQVRRSITDSIKDFVEYAEKQGSKSARMYYANITNMEYKALGMLEQSKSVTGNFRDTLDLMDLCFLQVAENIAKLAIQTGMVDNLHYKDVYVLAKSKVEEYARAVIWTKKTLPKD